MRAAAEADAANDRERNSYFESSPADMVLAGIGEELRGAYRDVTGADQPEHLLDLAQKLDELIAGGGDER